MASIFKARYNEHHAGLSSELFKWYQNGKHIDVTIHTDGQHILAHKLVLAANSPFFNGIFLDPSSKNSQLYFTDVPFQSMKSLIEYMYSGDLIVEREFLPACLQLADSLRVKGISGIGIDDIITEPAPVSANMHNLINTIMQQYPEQQQRVPCHQTPHKNLTRCQKKRQKRKFKKMLDRAGGSGTAVLQVPSKLVLKRIEHGYKLEQFFSPITVNNDNHQAVGEVHRQQSKDTYEDTTQHIQPQPVPNEAPVRSECENLQKNHIEDDMLLEPKAKDFKSIKCPVEKQASMEQLVQKDNLPHNQVTLVDSQYSTMHCQGEVSEERIENKIGTSKMSAIKTEKCGLTYNENTVEANKKAGFQINSDPKLKPETIKDSTAPKKGHAKPRVRKDTSKISAKMHLDQELERLFGDNYFGIDKKDNNNSDNTAKSLLTFLKPLEQCNQDPLVPIPMDVTAMQDMQDQKAEFKKRNGGRRKIPVCPPPEDISQNGKSSFACALCKRVYTHKSNYRRHYMVFHKRCAEAVFQCPMCKKKFTRSDNRTHHIRRIHGYTNTASLLSEEQPLFLCPICKKAFTKSFNRAFHIAEEHGIKFPPIIEK